MNEIAHAYREEIIIPLCAMKNNVDFLLENGKKTIVTTDEIVSDLISYKEIHILSDEAKELVGRLYRMSVFSFIKLWYKKYGDIIKMTFLYLKLKKKEDVISVPDKV